MNDSSSCRIVKLNIGGETFWTTQATLITREPTSKLHEWFHDLDNCPLPKDDQGRFFIDRDGVSFKYVLDWLRNGQLSVLDKAGRARGENAGALRAEALFYGLERLGAGLQGISAPGYITIGYQGSFFFGRQGVMTADVNFRKISRILVCGKVSLCREVFADTLNEGRDPDRGDEGRYSARFFLKHSVLEQAFDALGASGFRMVGASASGTSGPSTDPGMKPTSASSEEDRWAHYNEFVFSRS